MAELPPPFDDRSFREHARFVRALAGALARDRDEADEVAARTFASAVEQRPRAGALLRGWLARVARRALSRLRRDDARRDAHESAAARSERVDADPADLAARTELSDRIALAFAALDEPAKTTLFLRFYADLSPKQIAARQQVPVETVKTRLKRGLAKLRAQLDAQHDRTRGEWRATAIALAHHGTPWLGIAKAKGIAAAAVLMVLAGAVAWRKFAREPGSAAAASVESASAPLRASTDVAAIPPGAESDVASATADANAPQRSEERQLPFTSGVVTDEHGAPLADVRVVASFEDYFPSHAAIMSGMESPAAPSHAAALDVSRIGHDTLARTDRDGRFVVRAAPEKLAGLYFVAPGRAPASCFDLSSLSFENQGRRVTLAVGCTIRGHVRDHDGRPVSGAMVGASLVDAPPGIVVRGSHPLLPGGTIPPSRVLAMQSCIDADGSFELVLPRRSFRLDVGATGYVDDLEYCEGVDAEFDFTLSRSRTLLDVVDARIGAPVDGVRALVRWTDPSDHVDWVFASDFTAVAYLRAMKDENAHGPARLVVPRCSNVLLVADGYLSKSLELAGDPSEEPPHLTVVLEPGANSPSIQGTVRGGRLARVVLRWIRSRTQLEEAIDRMREEVMPELVDLNERPLAAYDVGADGHFSFGGLPPGSYCVDVGAPGRTPRRRVVTVPVKDVDFDLAASAQLEVLVVDGAGAPCADVKVHVQTKRDACAWSLRTNADGVAVFANLPDAELGLVAARELQDVFSGGVHPFERNAFFPKDDLALVAGETRRVQLVLVESVPVTLHVHDINERSIEGANIAISLQSAHVPGDLLRDDVRSLAGRVFETDVDGDLHLELVPSVWNCEVWADGHHFHQVFMLERGAARRIELELADG